MNATAAPWTNEIQDATKSTRLEASIHNQLADVISCWASLDLEVTEEFEFEDPCSDSSSDDCGRNVESRLPPPMPYFDRHARTPAPPLLLNQGVFSRVNSSPTTMFVAVAGNDLLQKKGMTQSMPNLHSSRSLYNRGIGYTVLSSATECGHEQGKHAMHARVREFEALLEDL